MILLDTNVISELMRPAPDERVAEWMQSLGSEPLCTSAITISEIVYGLERLPDGQRKQGLWDRFQVFVGPDSDLPILAFDESAAIFTGEFRNVREVLGAHAHTSDMMIAGIAAANEATLATRNTKDFEKLPITKIDPWSMSS